MKKTETVSIGRVGFICDKDAYEVLNEYLKRCSDALKTDQDSEEIMQDLESSMASHLKDLCADMVVDKLAAEKVIEIMGEVEITSESTNGKDRQKVEENSSENDNESILDKLKLKQPLFRDTNRGILGGVCAGIAKSLDVDPFWVRVFWVVTAFFYGITVPVYLVLWALLKDSNDNPESKTTAQEVINNIKDKITPTAEKIRPYERFLRKLFLILFKTIWNVLRILVCIVLVLTAIGWAGTLFFMMGNPASFDIFGGSVGWLEYILIISAGFIILIPLFELLSAMIRPRRFGSRMSLGLWSVWALSLIVASASFMNVFPKVRSYIIQEKPKNKFIYTEVHDNNIVDWCFSPLGTCSNRQTFLFETQRCGVDVTVYDKEDRAEWMSRGWTPEYLDYQVPVSQDEYCNKVRELSELYKGGNVLFADEVTNDPVYISTYTYNDGTNKSLWYMEYLHR